MKTKFLKKEEAELLNTKFRGKLAGTSWKFSQNIDGLIRTRIFMLIMSILVFYPILTNYLIHDLSSTSLLIERIIFSVMYLAGVLLFNRFRLLAIFLGVIPSILIFITYLNGQYFNTRTVAFTGAVVLLIGMGFYYHFRVNKLKKELEANLLENQLIDKNE